VRADLSDSETSYTGAMMLEGDFDIWFDELAPGDAGDAGDTRYAFFVGNTLYAGVEDQFGNTSDLIGEFFWFGSSIDRGSDFFVAVLKVRTTPELTDDWELESDDDIPSLWLGAETDLTTGSGSFRWDWSVPFDSYGWDAYGQVNLTTQYGLGLNTEGSVMQAASVDEDGVVVSESVQARGFLNTEYSVTTQYQIDLWRWEMMVNGGAGHMDWALILNNSDRAEQNAYHEFFLVMQTEEYEPFVLETLEFGGSVTDPVWYWTNDHSEFSAVLTGLTLTRPWGWEYFFSEDEDDDEDDEEEDEDDEEAEDDEDDEDEPEEEEPVEDEDDDEDDNPGNPTDRMDGGDAATFGEDSSGCSIASQNSSSWAVLLLAAGALLRRRQGR
jgi:hypothetical protein